MTGQIGRPTCAAFSFVDLVTVINWEASFLCVVVFGGILEVMDRWASARCDDGGAVGCTGVSTRDRR